MIIITGASKGIGNFLLKKYQSEGKDVIGTYHTTLPDSHLKNYFHKIDLTQFNKTRDWVNSLVADHHGITLINCAGINYTSFAHKAEIDSWANVITTNLVSLANIIIAVLPAMRKDTWGRIINMSSVVAQIGVPGASAYAASKAGLWGLVKSVAVENANLGITANNINLGYFDIGMINEVPEKFQTIIKEKIPSGEFGDREDIYSSVEYIINTPYLNGSSIDINGGIF